MSSEVVVCDSKGGTFGFEIAAGDRVSGSAGAGGSDWDSVSERLDKDERLDRSSPSINPKASWKVTVRSTAGCLRCCDRRLVFLALLLNLISPCWRFCVSDADTVILVIRRLVAAGVRRNLDAGRDKCSRERQIRV